jgi:hypothetical protein
MEKVVARDAFPSSQISQCIRLELIAKVAAGRASEKLFLRWLNFPNKFGKVEAYP